MKKKSPNYLSDSRPKFAPFEINCGKIPAHRYTGDLKSDMRQLVSAQEMYYGEHDVYFGDAGYPAAIGAYLTATPTDPSGAASPYAALDNSAASDLDEFCYYAKLENPNTTANGCTGTGGCPYYTASEGGNFYKTAVPGALGAAAGGCAIQD